VSLPPVAGIRGDKTLPRRAFRERRARASGVMTTLGLAGLILLSLAAHRPVEASEPATGTRTSSAGGETLDSKIRDLSVPPNVKPSSYEPIVITQKEANTYLRTQGAAFLPPAVESPELEIHPDYVSAVAEVDFDKLQQFGKQTNDIGAQVLGTLFKGRQKVSASGKLESGDGQGKLTIEKLSIGSTNIPDWLTQALLQNYLERVFKLDLSKPFQLPDHVTRIDLADGRATFIRSPNKKPPASHPSSN
jgi:hypothetical protein